MSSHTGRRLSPQRGHNSAGKINGNVYTQAQHGVVPGRRADGINGPFPIKPVYHKRSVQPGKQDMFEPYDLEIAAATKQQRDPSSTQEQLANGKEPNGSRDPRNSSDCRQPTGELQMDRAIHAGKLMLQDKLWTLAEKMRQKKQRDTAALVDQKREEQIHSRGHAGRGNPETKSSLSEQQRREPAGRRETKAQEREQDDFERHARIQNQEVREGRKMAVAESNKKATHRITFLDQEVSGELSKPQREKAEKEADEQNNSIWGETQATSQNGTVKGKERYQKTASVGDKGRERENKCRERAHEEKCLSSHEAATRGRKPPGGRTLPPVSGPSGLSRPEPGRPGQNQKADSSLQLFPCTICKRRFASARLQKHVQVCEKVKQTPRGVFNSSLQRLKGSQVEKFLETLGAVPVAQAEFYKK